MSEDLIGDPVPAVKESEAQGEIAFIFDDIRTRLGTSSVNLIWRHLAIFPGALPWCWGAIVPLFHGGELTEAARDYREGLRGPVLPQMPPDVRTALGLSFEDMMQISSTLRGYYVSCTMNILSLNALLLVLKGARSDSESAKTVETITGPGQHIPMEKMARLLSPADMPPHVAELAWRLNGLGERGDGQILASLYRYLANWPAFLGATWTLIAPLAADGRLDAAIERGLADADLRARELVPRLSPPARALAKPTHDAVCTALEDFGRNAIAKVIPITRTLLAVVGSGVDSPPPS